MRFIAAALLCLCPALVSAGEWLAGYAEGFDFRKADKPIFVYFTDSGRDKNWKSHFEGKSQLTDAYILVVADRAREEGRSRDLQNLRERGKRRGRRHRTRS